MMRESYKRDYMVGTRRSRRTGLLLLAASAIAVAAFAVWLSPDDDRDPTLVRTETGNPGAVGTSGALAPDADQEAAASDAGIIRDLETVTGSNDGHALVGRRVDLRAPISRHINDVAFWVGTGDNRLLVVLARDDRDGEDRQRGEPSNTALGSLRGGQQATISGSIQRVPYAEAMYSWGLTKADRTELMERRIYLKADGVSGS